MLHMIQGTFWSIVGFSILVLILIVFGIVALSKYLFTKKKHDE